MNQLLKHIKAIKEKSIQFKNWVPLIEKQIEQEYLIEYKNKIEPRFGVIWETIDDFKKALKKGIVKTVTKEFDLSIGNRSHCNSFKCLEHLVSTYRFPRDIERIKSGFEENALMLYPIILDFDDRLYCMSGNTRMDVARIMNIKPKVLILKVK